MAGYLARYEVWADPDAGDKGNPWWDMPEAIPYSRARMRSDATETHSVIIVNNDGSLTYDQAQVEIEVYPNE